MDIKKADIIIKGLSDAFPNHAKIWHIVREYNIVHESTEIHGIIGCLEADDLIIKTEGSYYKITHQGRSVLEDFGSLELFFESRENEKATKVEIENVKFNKLKNDAKLSNWQVKTFWPVFIFGLIGGICGIISLGMQVTAKNSQQQNKSIVIPTPRLKTDTLELKKATHLSETKK